MNEILLVTFQARRLHYQADVFHITAVCFHFYSVRNLVTNPSRIREVLLILNQADVLGIGKLCFHDRGIRNTGEA